MLLTLFSIATQQIILSIHFVIDNFMANGEISIAALASSNKFMLLVRSMLTAISTAGSTLIVQFNARNDRSSVKKTYIVTALFSLAIALIFVIVYLLNKEALISTFSDDLDVKRYATSYLNISIYSALTLSQIMPLLVLLRAANGNSPFFITIFSLLVHISLNWLFIYSNLGFNLGVFGNGLATIISDILALISLLVIAIYKYKALWIRFKIKDATKFLLLASPIVSANILSSLALFLSHNLFGAFGAKELSAYGLISSFEGILFDLFAGIGIASVVIIGKELGSKNFEKAYSYGSKVIYAVTASSLLIGITVLTFKHQIVNLFYSDPETIAYAYALATVFGFMLSARTLNATLSNGILNSGGDNLFLMITSIITDWVICLPSLFISYHVFHIHLMGAYIVFNISDFFAASMLFIRFRSKKWLRNLISED